MHGTPISANLCAWIMSRKFVLRPLNCVPSVPRTVSAKTDRYNQSSRELILVSYHHGAACVNVSRIQKTPTRSKVASLRSTQI